MSQELIAELKTLFIEGLHLEDVSAEEIAADEPLFGEGGGERIAQEYETTLLGQLPLHKTIREQTDAGTPTVVAEPDSEVALMYRDIARKVTAELSQRAKNFTNLFPEIIVSQD